MLFNRNKNEIYCYQCKEWKSIYTEVINPDTSWECLKCFSILAFDEDFGEEYFEEI
jgi:hypothetical protein